ncbi:MAG TPA: hypothetical protein VNI01_02245 [Elusimicrobiota bacterium]|nr:hypothetical protein [Elusimicrobiota bacterium]
MLRSLSLIALLAAPAAAQDLRLPESAIPGAPGVFGGRRGNFGQPQRQPQPQPQAAAVANPPPRVRIEEVDAAIVRGRAYLADKGTKYDDAASYWGDMTYENLKNRNAYVAVSALVAEALRGSPVAAEREAAAKASDYVRKRAAEDYPRAEGGVLFSPYRMSYGLMELLSQEKSPERDAQVKRLLEEISTITVLPQGLRYSTGECSGQDDANFQLALLSLAVSKAQAAGFKVPKVGAGETARDLNVALAQRMGAANGYYTGSKTASEVNRAGRSPLCELARLEAGCEGGGPKALRAAQDNFTARTPELVNLQKFGDQFWSVQDCKGRTVSTPHNPGNEQLATYFVLFGFYWQAKSLAKSGPLEAEDSYHRLGAALVKMQSADGWWEDNPTYAGKSYGTASAVVTLLEVRAGLERAKAEREKAQPPTGP